LLTPISTPATINLKHTTPICLKEHASRKIKHLLTLRSSPTPNKMVDHGSSLKVHSVLALQAHYSYKTTTS
jgi:hypothetical protein